MDDSRLLQESNLVTRQPQGDTSIIQAITGEGLAQGPYVVARGGVEPTTFRTEGTDHHHSTNHALLVKLQQCRVMTGDSVRTHDERSR